MLWETLPIAWVTVAVILIGAEMLTGTFYLLVLGISAAAGGLAAWLGAPFSSQLGLTVVVGLAGAVLVWHWHKRNKTASSNALSNNLDIGKPVSWKQSNPDGSWQVMYRGTVWQASPAKALTTPDKLLFIVDMQGNTLIVDN